MNTFSEWLNSKLKELDWTQADLARASGLTRATISYYLGPKSKKPDEDALRKIAKAFKLPVEAVFRAAGVLPPTTNDPWIEDMNHKISQLTGIRREMAERLLNTLLIEQDHETKPTPKTSSVKISH
jgi:transcriptional regulator with XRE-family HTH domain